MYFMNLYTLEDLKWDKNTNLGICKVESFHTRVNFGYFLST